MKPTNSLLTALALICLTQSLSAARIKGRVFDFSDGKTPLDAVTVVAIWEGGKTGEPLRQSAGDGAYMIEVKSNTKVTVVYGGGGFHETRWVIDAGGDSQEHAHDELVLRRFNSASPNYRYFEQVGVALAKLSTSQQTRFVKDLWPTAIDAAARVSIAAGLVKTRTDADQILPTATELAKGSATEVNALANLFSASLTNNRTLPSKQQIGQQKITLPSNAVLIEVVNETASKMPEQTELILANVEKNWNSQVRAAAESVIQQRANF